MSALVSMYPSLLIIFFFFTDPATTQIYTLSLHDALPISSAKPDVAVQLEGSHCEVLDNYIHEMRMGVAGTVGQPGDRKSTRLIQSRRDLVCRLLLEKKKKHINLC